MKIDGAVFYTDGSARPNPGACGSGNHGYTYIYPTEKQKATRVEAYMATDAGYVLNKDLSASGAREVHVLTYIDAFQSTIIAGTNNVAEINAVTMAVKCLIERYPNVPRIHVLTDSEYVVKNVQESLPRWLQNGWKTATGAPVKNQREWVFLNDAICAFKGRDIPGVSWSIAWVRGHNNELGNVKADYLASIATNHSQAGISNSFFEESPALGYHKNTIDMDPLFSHKRIYFNTDPELNTPGMYYQTGYSSNDHITGKRTSDASFSVIRLNTPNDVLETIIAAHSGVRQAQNAIVFAKLDRVRSVDVYPYLKKHGRYALISDPRNRSQNFIDYKPVTQEVRPGELPLRTIDVLSHLEEILTEFEEFYVETLEMKNKGIYRVHDITGHFYDFSEKKKGGAVVTQQTLKKDFGVGVKQTKVKVTEEVNAVQKELDLLLLFADDIPTRNAFKSIEPDEPSVYVVTWSEAAGVIRYATIICTQNASSIWCNYFANQVLI